MSKGKKNDGTAKKSTKGIPRVTDKVRAMDAAGQSAWLAEVTKKFSLSATVVAEITARLNAPAKVKTTGRKVNFAKVFEGRDMDSLLVAQKALDAAIAATKDSELDKINALIAEAQQKKAQLLAAKGETVNA